jgi:hypothetical protein
MGRSDGDCDLSRMGYARGNDIGTFTSPIEGFIGCVYTYLTITLHIELTTNTKYKSRLSSSITDL